MTLKKSFLPSQACTIYIKNYMDVGVQLLVTQILKIANFFMTKYAAIYINSQIKLKDSLQIV